MTAAELDPARSYDLIFAEVAAWLEEFRPRAHSGERELADIIHDRWLEHARAGAKPHELRGFVSRSMLTIAEGGSL